MAYIILKKIKDAKHYIIVNDSEGIPIEFKTQEKAESIAKMFRANTTRDSIYEVKKIG